jgi:hypothetical protein
VLILDGGSCPRQRLTTRVEHTGSSTVLNPTPPAQTQMWEHAKWCCGAEKRAMQLKVLVLELSHGDEVFSAEMGLKAVVQAVYEVDALSAAVGRSTGVPVMEIGRLLASVGEEPVN